MSDYFGTSARGEEHTQVARGSDLRAFEVSPGVTIRPVMGARLNINVVELEPGAVAPVHTHDEEQLGCVVRGTATFTDGERSWELVTGDTYHAPSGAPHGATGGPDGCTIIDAFAPPRAGIRELLES